MRRKNKILAIIIIIILVLLLSGGAFAYIYLRTDLVKNPQEMFYRYFGMNKDILEATRNGRTFRILQ